MKLNESRLIIQIMKLASQIRETNDETLINSCADGIISICSIIDTENFVPYQFPPADIEAKVQALVQVDDTIGKDIFSPAREEQQNVTE